MTYRWPADGYHRSALDPYAPTGDLVSDPRPNPLSTAASKVGTAWAAAGGVLSALVAFGVLTAAQGDAIAAVGETAPSTITALGTLIAGVLPLISGVVASFRTVAAGKDEVTPLADPMNDKGERLTPEGH